MTFTTRTAPATAGILIVNYTVMADGVADPITSMTINAPTGTSNWTVVGGSRLHAGTASPLDGITTITWAANYTAGASIAGLIATNAGATGNKQVGSMQFISSATNVADGGSLVSTGSNTAVTSPTGTFVSGNAGVALWIGTWHSAGGGDTLTLPTAFSGFPSPGFLCLTGADALGVGVGSLAATGGASIASATGTLSPASTCRIGRLVYVY